MTSESIVHLVGVLNGEHFRLKGKLLPVSQKPNLLISVESIVLCITVVSHRYCWLYGKIIYAVFTSIKRYHLTNSKLRLRVTLKNTSLLLCVAFY